MLDSTYFNDLRQQSIRLLAGKQMQALRPLVCFICSVSSRNPGKGEENKQDKDQSWVAKFFEGSDEDEPQWEKEPTPIKEKVIELLDREKERSKFWGRLAVLALGVRPL